MDRQLSLIGLEELPISSIEPSGWLRALLERQRDGLTSHLPVAGPPFGVQGWDHPEANATQIVWEPYEQDGYWIDGMIRCALLLKDSALTDRARGIIDRVLESADDDGYLGNRALKFEAPQSETWSYARRRRWAHAVFFRALMADGMEVGRSEKIITALHRHYDKTTYPHIEEREVCNVETMLWVAARTGDTSLRDRAQAEYERFNVDNPESPHTVSYALSTEQPQGHGVTYNEMAKLGAVLYRYTGDERLLAASVHAYEKLEATKMLVDGVGSSSESIRGVGALDSHETCNISDQTWSQGYLLMATEDAVWADRIERACLNAGLGSITKDFRALQYFSCPNQIVATSHSDHTPDSYGSERISYRPRPGTPCCPGNVHRYMPNYAARMWLRRGENDIVKVLYGASTLSTTVCGVPITIIETSEFPFEDIVQLRIECDRPVQCTLDLRIPSWTDNASVSLNEKMVSESPEPGTFFRLDRTFKHNDTVELHFPMTIKSTRWPGDARAFEYGPIVFSMPVEADRTVDTCDTYQSETFPAWNMTPRSRWNYGVRRDTVPKLIRTTTKRGVWPWDAESSPLKLRLPVIEIPDWTIREECSAATHNQLSQFTPELPSRAERARALQNGTERIIELVPYGATLLRLTVFPAL